MTRAAIIGLRVFLDHLNSSAVISLTALDTRGACPLGSAHPLTAPVLSPKKGRGGAGHSSGFSPVTGPHRTLQSFNHANGVSQ